VSVPDLLLENALRNEIENERHTFTISFLHTSQANEPIETSAFGAFPTPEPIKQNQTFTNDSNMGGVHNNANKFYARAAARAT
jgi:hypothetical protein